MKRVEFNVIGMHCVSCSSGISKLLKKQKPVTDVEVILSQSKIFVSYDETLMNNQHIIDSVARLGYKAVVVSES